ncbi:hypothetical protein KFK09_025102 [Dendrobium nobile]|uniref:3'(2'),5'-bisphosphate nucleotidase n=1 Tax=Dendrobium nobile TaxID=94219 RepID=A0A8T3AEH5_DENNO|nr:hypothetical protein KFK09_025102 [Dendrobium nobile]
MWGPTPLLSLIGEEALGGNSLGKEEGTLWERYWGVQATVSWVLSQCFGSENVSIVAEEDTQTLSERMLLVYWNPLSKLKVWVLDPVDGTLGFVRGDQYAIALALIEDGEVVLGILGCPNYPMKKQWLNYHQRYYRLISKISPPVAGSWHKGCVMYALRGSGKAWMQPLVYDHNKFGLHNISPKPIKVSSVDDPAFATFCEPVEKSNSKHSFTAGLAQSVGLRKQPLRVYSMVKYAAIACGDAEIFMKFAKAGYKEKIWDHAAGVIIIHEAGGVVTDAGGKPLDFTKGIYLEGLDRGIVACSGSLLHDKIITAVDASWDSSKL